MCTENPCKTLIADDEPQNLKFLFDAFTTEKYQILSASNGAVACDLAVRYLPKGMYVVQVNIEDKLFRMKMMKA